MYHGPIYALCTFKILHYVIIIQFQSFTMIKTMNLIMILYTLHCYRLINIIIVVTLRVSFCYCFLVYLNLPWLILHSTDHYKLYQNNLK